MNLIFRNSNFSYRICGGIVFWYSGYDIRFGIVYVVDIGVYVDDYYRIGCCSRKVRGGGGVF